MTTLRNIWADLVEKRLWPVAVVLAAGLLAVPLVLAKGGDDPVDAARGRRRDRRVLGRGRHRDRDARRRADGAPPRRPRPRPVRAAQVLHAREGAGPGRRPRRPTPAPAAAAAAATRRRPIPRRRPTARVEVVEAQEHRPDLHGRPALRAGGLDEDHAATSTRLTPLPSASSPFFVFLGAKGGGKTARLPRLLGRQGDRRRHVQAEQERLRDHRAAGRRHRVLRPDDRRRRPAVPDGHHQDREAGDGVEVLEGRTVAHAAPRRPTARLLRKVLDGRAAHLMGSYRWDAERGVLVHVRAWDDKDPPAARLRRLRRRRCRSPAPAPTERAPPDAARRGADTLRSRTWRSSSSPPASRTAPA